MRCVRLVVLFAAGISGACASSNPTPDLATPTERTVAVDDQTVYRTSVLPNAKSPVTAPPSRTFEALKAVYDELGIPPKTSDPATGRFGNPDFWKTRRLGNEPIATYVSCGSSISGPITDTHRIYMSLLSIVRPDGKGGSELETAFSASAQSMDGAAADRITCGSTGRLEDRIRKGVILKVTGLSDR